jgi:signal transduction histidine kinase
LLRGLWVDRVPLDATRSTMPDPQEQTAVKTSTQVSLAAGAILVLLIGVNAMALFSVRSLNGLMTAMVRDDVASVRAAAELQSRLFDQRSMVRSYILDGGDPAWLARLEQSVPAVSEQLERLAETAQSPDEARTLADLRRAAGDYGRWRDAAVALFRRGQLDESRQVLRQEVTVAYEQVCRLCGDFMGINERGIDARLAQGQREIARNDYLVTGYVLVVLALCLTLLWLFHVVVVRPVRQMARDAESFAGATPQPASAVVLTDELRTVGFHLGRLMSDVAATRTDLQRSREQLLQAEKLASVGKLAASVAHEIRNPLTSLRMRVYELQKELVHNAVCSEDLRVIADEIVRLDRIIRSFLEFARAPALELQSQSLAALADAALDLCGHWLVERDITVVTDHADGVPLVVADAEQIKQVLVNLLVNACEAMPGGGVLRLSTRRVTGDDGRSRAVVRVHDAGSGIPPEYRARVFEPFFTTKERGTGLGLCIAANIMLRHGGGLELVSSDEGGSCFAATLPVPTGANP